MGKITCLSKCDNGPSVSSPLLAVLVAVRQICRHATLQDPVVRATYAAFGIVDLNDFEHGSDSHKRCATSADAHTPQASNFGGEQ